MTFTPTYCPDCGCPSLPGAPFCKVCGEILDSWSGRVDDGEEA